MSCKSLPKNIGNRKIFLAIAVLTFFLLNITLVFAELNYTTGESIYGIMADGTKTGALNITFQVRSCDDSACSGETFVGPDNTSSTYFTNASYNTLNETLSPNNTYFQYKAFFWTEDQNYSSMLFNVSIGRTYIDATTPLISFVSPTPTNNSGKTSEFELNVSITEQYLANVTYNWNGTNTTYELTNNASYFTGSAPNWAFNLTQTGLVIGQSYTYQVFVTDFAGNSNSTEVRTIKGNSAPTFISISHTPTSADDIDPNVLINITANVSDTDNNFDSAILQYKNSTSNWTNKTMSNLTAKGLYTLMNANFTPDTEGNWTYRIWANDTQADSATSSNTSLNASWDCTWTITSSLGAVSGWDENKEIGNITINNTGDSEFADNNCSLDFRLTYDLPEERIYFDNVYYKPSSIYALSAGTTQNISINATFLSEVNQEDVIITTDEVSGRSGTSGRNTTATIVSNQAGPYLYQKITSSPSTLYLTPQNFSLQGYLRNLMGSATVNENNTAYNVTFNWTLASGFTNVSGNSSTNFTNITDNELHYNNINVSFSNLVSMTSGVKTFYLYVQGYNLSGDLIADADNQVLLTEQINITFLCYSVADNVYVTSCGNLDGDYTAPSTATSSGGGGGGGTGVLTTYEASKTQFELLIGEEQEFILEIKNKLTSYKENVKISVSGINAEYIKIIPDEISDIAPKSSKNITVKITVPAYFTQGEYKLVFLIKGDLISNTTKTTFSEKKIVTLYIVEVSRDKADEMLGASEQMIKDMNSSGMVIKDISEFLEKVFDSYNKTDFLGVKNNYEKIKDIYDAAFDSLKIINDLKEKIEQAENRGIEIIETKKILYVAEVAFDRGDYFLALDRLKQAKLTYALETKGEFSIYYAVKNNPLESLVALIGFGIFSFGSSLIVRLRFYKKKLKLLQEEEKLLLELMGVVQRQCFEKKHMSMEEYAEAMGQYEKKLSKTIQDKIKTETKIANLLKIKGKKKALFEEKKRLVKLMKELQDKYLNKGKMETRVYENMLHSYSTKLSEVEEQITFLEAQKAFGSNKLSEKISKFLRFKK